MKTAVSVADRLNVAFHVSKYVSNTSHNKLFSAARPSSFYIVASLKLPPPALLRQPLPMAHETLKLAGIVKILKVIAGLERQWT